MSEPDWKFHEHPFIPLSEMLLIDRNSPPKKNQSCIQEDKLRKPKCVIKNILSRRGGIKSYRTAAVRYLATAT